MSRLSAEPSQRPPQSSEPADVAEMRDHGEAWEREVDRRIEEVRSGKVETIPAEQVFAEIDAELARRAQNRASRTVGKSRR